MTNWYPTRMFTPEEEADWLARSLAELPPDASEAKREQCRNTWFIVARELRLEALEAGLARELEPWHRPPPPPPPMAESKRRQVISNLEMSWVFEQQCLAELREEQAQKDAAYLAERAAAKQWLVDHPPNPPTPRRRVRKKLPPRS